METGGYKKGYVYPDNLHWTDKLKRIVENAGYKIVKHPQDDDEITWAEALKIWNSQSTKIIRTKKKPDPFTGKKVKYNVNHKNYDGKQILYLLEQKTNDPKVEAYRKKVLDAVRMVLNNDIVK